MTRRVLVAAFVAAATASVPHADFYDGLAAYRRGDFDEALRQLEPVAARGEVEAQYLVGSIHADPSSGRVEHEAAFEWFRKAAEQGHARAQHRLGGCYERGLGVEPDPAAAALWYRHAAIQGLAAAQADLAVLIDEGRGVQANPSKAAGWFRDAAEQGNARAQFRLAEMFVSGRGVEANPEKAAKWYRRAAKQGHPDAQNALALMLDAGRGMGRNPTRAATWFRRAAEQGLPAACRNLGSMYAQGDGVPLDPDEARRWFALAAGAEPVPVELLRDEVAETLEFELPPGFESDEVAAEVSGAGHRTPPTVPPGAPDPSVEASDAEALYQRGRAYSTGDGVEQDHAEAERWYLRAAELGHAMSWYRLGFAHMRGQNARGRKDNVRAYAWFSLAAEWNLGDASSWRDRIGKNLKPSQIEQAEALVESYRSYRSYRSDRSDKPGKP